MQKELKDLDDERVRFRAKFEELGCRDNYHGYPETTILLVDICRLDTMQQVIDHQWFVFGKRFESLNLQPGDVIEFDALVVPYSKGYVNFREYVDQQKTDYKLSRPTKIVKVEKGESNFVNLVKK
ncbi:hypothetical protein FACHB389_10700 [Nostoc calcicola FACHB-389]|nr:hypothetical protein [Nostoc calcicola FACHB-3891]OKH36974.1 hypothetical protein FACHB389_10700 [Nostoc calcicola FACHB-389]